MQYNYVPSTILTNKILILYVLTSLFTALIIVIGTVLSDNTDQLEMFKVHTAHEFLQMIDKQI